MDTRRRLASILWLAAIPALLVGCSASSLKPISLTPQLVQHPVLGEEHTAQIGDSVVSTSRLVSIPAIHVAEAIDYRTKYMALPASVKIAAGTFPARYMHNEETCYVPPEKATVGGDPMDLLLCVSPTGTVRVAEASDAESEFASASPIRFERTTLVDRTAPNFEQELVYNGRAGSVLKFLYREFISDRARPPFTQDVQYDLIEGKTIGFKEARIEVLDATNTSITYRVVSHFPPPQI